MRVFLPWRAANQLIDSAQREAGDESDEEEHSERSFDDESSSIEERPDIETDSLKRTGDDTAETEAASAAEDATNGASLVDSCKRPRLDHSNKLKLPPAAKPAINSTSEITPGLAATLPSYIEAMTAGIPVNPADEDEKPPATTNALRWQYDEPLLENTPQDAFSSPTTIYIRPMTHLPMSLEVDHHETTLSRESTDASAGGSFCKQTSTSPEDNEDGDDASFLPDSAFQKALQKRGLKIVEMAGDGNCLFRAVALQVYGDNDMHFDVRARVCDFMEGDKQLASFLDEPLQDYVARKRKDGVHGNNPEIQAVSELFNRPVEVFTPDSGGELPLNIFQKEYATPDEPIRLSYHDGNHYNAVIDPLKPTAGLGLGLPGLKIGLADELQVSKAIAESDLSADHMELKRILEESTEDEVRRIMKESKVDRIDMMKNADDDEDEEALQRALKESAYSYDYLYQKKALGLSDLEATNFELEQTILQSSIDSYRRQELGRKQRASPGRRRRTSPTQPQQPMNTYASANDRGDEDLAVDTEALVAPVAAAAAPSVAVAAAACPQALPPSPPPLGAVDEYPQSVQELVMNGFELSKVVRAVELIGDDFDDLLAFLMSNSFS